jgi:ATP-binding cassette, subfamily B, bacterial
LSPDSGRVTEHYDVAIARPFGSFGASLAAYLRPQSARAALLGVVLLASTGLQLVNPQILRRFIDATQQANAPVGYLTQAAVLFIGIALVQQVLVVGAAYLSLRVGWTATNALRADLAMHCLTLDLSFHKARTPGELIERIDGDVTAVANFFSKFVVKILGNLLLLVGVLVVMWLTDWRAGLALTLYAAVVLATLARLRAVAIPYWAAARQASAELYGFLEERLAGTADIRACGAPAYVLQRLYAYTAARFRAGSRARVYGSIPWSVNLLFYVMGYVVAFVIAAYLFSLGSMTLGTAFLIYFYTLLLFQPLNEITHQVEDFQKAGAGLRRAQELQAITSALADGPGAAFPPSPLAVEFENVSFGYGDDEMVVHDLTFRIEPGTILGLLGRTGSGKTTITRLLFRLYDPAAGTVRLGGVDVRQARLAELRRHVGLVTQDVQLFRATVRDNVTFFDRSIDDADVWRAFADLGLEEWCRALPAGLDTMLGPSGTGVSAGEAQLLAFTRVFLKEPGLVVLDEASSRLDPATERLVDRAVDRLLRGRTGIIIAHRLATIQRADAIMILEDGRVREHGRRADLVADPGSRLSELLRTGLEQVLV